MKTWRPYTLWTLAIGLLLVVAGCTQSATEAEPERKVYVAETETGYQLIKDGEPFFVKGACVRDDNWAEFKAAGGNTIRIYDTIGLRERLDRADSLGLMVAVDIPLPKYSKENNWYAIPGNAEKVIQKITEVVSSHKDHPALLFWILGNELLYPISPTDGQTFIEHFNSWIDLIHSIDPHHPLTSAITSFSRLTITSMFWRSPNLDFISVNYFGAINSLNSRLQVLAPLWKGPFMITEWGINGPWEAREFTSWDIPIEQTSTKKAEIIVERYQVIKKLSASRTLGSFLYYWGRTNSYGWYSTFLPDGRPTQTTYEVAAMWGEEMKPYTGPKLGYILLEGQGAPSSITLGPGKEVTASIHEVTPDLPELTVQWEIRPENWEGHQSWKASLLPQTNFYSRNPGEVGFSTPTQEGPYRLYLYLGDKDGQVATANIPFYVLNPEDAK